MWGERQNTVIVWRAFMDLNTVSNSVLAICAFMGMIATGGALFVRMTVHDQLDKFMKELREDFVTKDELKAVWVILERRQYPRKRSLDGP